MLYIDTIDNLPIKNIEEIKLTYFIMCTFNRGIVISGSTDIYSLPQNINLD